MNKTRRKKNINKITKNKKLSTSNRSRGAIGKAGKNTRNITQILDNLSKKQYVTNEIIGYFVLSAKNPNLAAGFVPGGVYHQLIVIMVYAGIKDGIPLCKLYTLDAGGSEYGDFTIMLAKVLLDPSQSKPPDEGIKRVYLKVYECGTGIVKDEHSDNEGNFKIYNIYDIEQIVNDFDIYDAVALERLGQPGVGARISNRLRIARGKTQDVIFYITGMGSITLDDIFQKIIRSDISETNSKIDCCYKNNGQYHLIKNNCRDLIVCGLRAMQGLIKDRGLVENRIKPSDVTNYYKSLSSQGMESDSGPNSSESKQSSNICSDREQWYINFMDKVSAIELSLRQSTCNDNNQSKIESVMSDMRNNLVKCKDDGSLSAIQGKVTAFNDLYNKFEIWLGSRPKKTPSLNKIPVSGPASGPGDDRYVCRTGRCVPNKDGKFSTREDCEKTCTYETTTDKTLPPQFFRPDGGRLSARELFNSFGVTKPKPTNVDVVKILRKLYPGVSFQEELKNKEAYKELQKAKDALDPNVVTEDTTWNKDGYNEPPGPEPSGPESSGPESSGPEPSGPGPRSRDSTRKDAVEQAVKKLEGEIERAWSASRRLRSTAEKFHKDGRLRSAIEMYNKVLRQVDICIDKTAYIIDIIQKNSEFFNLSEIEKYQGYNRRYIGYNGIINGKIDELLESEKESYMDQERYGPGRYMRPGYEGSYSREYSDERRSGVPRRSSPEPSVYRSRVNRVPMRNQGMWETPIHGDPYSSSPPRHRSVRPDSPRRAVHLGSRQRGSYDRY